MPCSLAQTMRYHYLDNIRWVTVLLVMFFHVFYFFNAYCVGSGIGGFTDFQPQDVVVYLLYPWLMPLLFVVAGMSSRYALQRKSPREYLRSRTVKLLVPATLGLFVFQWVSGYFGMQVMNFRFHADMGAGQPWWVMYIMWAVCGGGGRWFIQLLWVCSLITIPLHWCTKKMVTSSTSVRQTWQTIVWLLVFGLALYLSNQMVMDNHGNMQDPSVMFNVYRPMYYLTAYLFGYYFFVREDVQSVLMRLAEMLIIAALLSAIWLVVSTFGKDAYSSEYIKSIANNVCAWLSVLAMIAAFRKWGNSNVSNLQNPPLQRLATFLRDASYGLYILQFFVYMSVGYILRAYTALPPWSMYVLLMVAMFSLTPALYYLFSRIPVFRYCVLGIKNK